MSAVYLDMAINVSSFHYKHAFSFTFYVSSNTQMLWDFFSPQETPQLPPFPVANISLAI